ncbi:MAG: hypothetical protein O7E57_07505 [Gammaproteobacteria bacterium]|nr:hypothetical protein [Gammaproteobacteria bacterium]
MKPLIVLVFLFCAVSSHAAPRPPSPPPETEHFAPLLGSWLVSGRSLSPDGQTWKENPHPALWTFYGILNDHGIQDDWTSPAPHIAVAEATRTYGTNIRIFNNTERRWEMAWIDSTNQLVRSFTATSSIDQIIMNSVGRTPPRRNIFYEMTSEGFRWRQEWTFDEGKTWVPVSYLEATAWQR